MDPSRECQPHSNLLVFLVPSLTWMLYRDVPGPPHQQNKDTVILQVVLQRVCKVLCQALEHSSKYSTAEHDSNLGLMLGSHSWLFALYWLT